jgi:hypothetical protein
MYSWGDDIPEGHALREARNVLVQKHCDMFQVPLQAVKYQQEQLQEGKKLKEARS